MRSKGGTRGVLRHDVVERSRQRRTPRGIYKGSTCGAFPKTRRAESTAARALGTQEPGGGLSGAWVPAKRRPEAKMRSQEAKWSEVRMNALSHEQTPAASHARPMVDGGPSQREQMRHPLDGEPETERGAAVGPRRPPRLPAVRVATSVPDSPRGHCGHSCSKHCMPQIGRASSLAQRQCRSSEFRGGKPGCRYHRAHRGRIDATPPG